MLWFLAGSILTTLDAKQDIRKANNFKTDANLEDHAGGSKGKKKKTFTKKERLRFKADGNGCTRKLWNVKTGLMRSGVTIWERKEIK